MTLCSICSHFDFEGLLDLETPVPGYQKAPEGYQLGSIDEISSREKCPLCQLISRGINCYWPSAPRAEVTFLSVDNISGHRHLSVHSDFGLDFEVDKVEPWKTSFARKRRKRVTFDLDIYPTRETTRTKCLASRHMLPDLDMNIPRRWIQKCESDHGQGCQRAYLVGEELPDGFMLIDVNTRCIVQAPSHARFLALSYVWGSATDQFRTSKKHLEASGNGKITAKTMLQLPEQLTQVIEDAIDFTRGLGERFLWVDALCIVHDDPLHLTTQLNAMDRIYEQAVLTVIAAPGFSFSNHLPGCSKTPRDLHSIKGDISGSEFVIRLPPEHAVIDAISRSPWIHRAWTFQEGLLSQRRLIFTNQEVFFLCGTDLWSESCEDPTGDQKILISPWSTVNDEGWISALFNNRSLQSPIWQFKHYTSLVRAYLSRDITHISDSLNAFKGLELRIQNRTGMKFFWGLPEGEDFYQALLWLIPDPQASSPVRDGFPSWSWVGWFKDPYYVRIPGVTEEATIDEPPHVQGIPGAKFWKETEDGKMDEVDTTTEMSDVYNQTRKPPPQYKSHMYVESMVATFDIKQVNAEEDPCIFFQGRNLAVVKFQRISARDINRKIINKSCEFLAVSANSMWLAERDFRGFQFNMFRMETGKKNGKDNGPLNAASRLIEHRDWVTFNTMVLEWHDGMAKCLAMCQIKDEIWNAASPQKKIVKLG